MENVGLGVSFFLSLQISLCVPLSGVGRDEQRGSEYSCLIVQAVSWVRCCGASSRSWLRRSLPLWRHSCFYTLYSFTALALWAASLGGVRLGMEKVHMLLDVLWERFLSLGKPSLPIGCAWELKIWKHRPCLFDVTIPLKQVFACAPVLHKTLRSSRAWTASHSSLCPWCWTQCPSWSVYKCTLSWRVEGSFTCIGYRQTHI